MAKLKLKPLKIKFKQETQKPIVKGKMGELNVKSATKLKSDRKKP